MALIEYSINARTLTAFAPIQDELSYQIDKNYLFDLSYLGCLDVTGSRSHEFLQGQISCDLREVSASQIRQGAMCNLKGRILTLLNVVEWHGLHLILPNDLLAETQASLAKTAMFSQVKLSASSYQLFGFYLQNRRDLIPLDANLPEEQYGVVHGTGYCCYHLGAGHYVYMIDSHIASLVNIPFIEHGQWRGSLAWHALQLYMHRCDIYPQSRGLFLPHRLDLHLTGHLNFNKGCYKGQEIIARMHYRAKRKHEMALFTVELIGNLQPGVALFNSDHIEVGELIDFCPIDANTYLVAASVIFDCPSICYVDGALNPFKKLANNIKPATVV